MIPSASCLSFSVFLCVTGRAYRILTGEGEGGGRGANTYDCKKAWPSINHSVLSASKYLAREWELILKSELS